VQLARARAAVAVRGAGIGYLPDRARWVHLEPYVDDMSDAATDRIRATQEDGTQARTSPVYLDL
jgi:hypothetical protein